MQLFLYPGALQNSLLIVKECTKNEVANGHELKLKCTKTAYFVFSVIDLILVSPIPLGSSQSGGGVGRTRELL